jgi:hypothetical protein
MKVKKKKKNPFTFWHLLELRPVAEISQLNFFLGRKFGRLGPIFHKNPLHV